MYLICSRLDTKVCTDFWLKKQWYVYIVNVSCSCVVVVVVWFSCSFGVLRFVCRCFFFFSTIFLKDVYKCGQRLEIY